MTGDMSVLLRGCVNKPEVGDLTEECTEDKLAALKELQEHYCEETLWTCIVAFQNTVMWTASGLPFQYKLKVGRNGRYTKELWVDRREDSKSLAFSSVKLAFSSLHPDELDELHKDAKETHKYRTLVERPKALGDIRGVSYIYALFYNFGLIDVPDKFKANMQGTIEHV